VTRAGLLPLPAEPTLPGDSMPPRSPRPTSARVPLPLTPERLVARVEAEGTPLVDPVPGRPGRRIVTFAWLADEPCTSVTLVANKLTDLSDPADTDLVPVPGIDGAWSASYEVAADWRASYLFVPNPGEACRDPRNPRTIASKFDIGDLSIAAMPEAPAVGPWARRPGVAAGNVEVHRARSNALDGERDVWIARAGASLDQPAERVLVLFDGEVWARVLPILPLLDNLVADGTIPPTLVVMIDSLGPQRREAELTCRDAMIDLAVEWTARAAERSGTPLHPSTTVIAGQSLGGLAAAYAVLTRPEVFGRALCQSPSLWWPSRPGEEEWLTRAYATAPPAPRRLSLQVGTDEWVLIEPVHRLAATLREHGEAGCELVDLHTFAGGHDHACWQAALAPGLIPLLR